jgi:hypothetical protein
MNREWETFRAQLRRFANRLNRGATIARLLWLGTALLALCEAWLFCSLRLGHRNAHGWAAAIGLLAGAGLLWIFARRRFTLSDTALYLDLKYGLKERLVTALESRRDGRRPALERTLLRQSAETLRNLPMKKAVPFRPSKAIPLVLAALAFLLMLILMPRGEAPPGSGERLRLTFRLRGMLLKNAARDLVRGAGLTGDAKEAIAKADSFGDALMRGNLEIEEGKKGPYQTEKILSRELERLHAMRELLKGLSEIEPFTDMARSLLGGNRSAAGKEIARLEQFFKRNGLESRTRAALEELAKAMEKGETRALIEALARAGEGKNPEATRETLRRLMSESKGLRAEDSLAALSSRLQSTLKVLSRLSTEDAGEREARSGTPVSAEPYLGEGMPGGKEPKTAARRLDPHPEVSRRGESPYGPAAEGEMPEPVRWKRFPPRFREVVKRYFSP